jgi:exopolyphosphatase/guanosine-5'-triphosphate,3'-diphosphate pyrophosphatase
MRVGVVDLGTNSTRLLVAEVDDGRVEEVARHTQITRLGEGVDERRRLLPLPIARVRNVLAVGFMVVRLPNLRRRNVGYTCST